MVTICAGRQRKNFYRLLRCKCRGGRCIFVHYWRMGLTYKTKLLMKTLEQLKGLTSKCLDGRDFNRLAKFIPYNMIKDFGMEPNEEYNNEERWNSTVVEFTRENVLKQLE